LLRASLKDTEKTYKKAFYIQMLLLIHSIMTKLRRLIHVKQLGRHFKWYSGQETQKSVILIHIFPQSCLPSEAINSALSESSWLFFVCISLLLCFFRIKTPITALHKLSRKILMKVSHSLWIMLAVGMHQARVQTGNPGFDTPGLSHVRVRSFPGSVHA